MDKEIELILTKLKIVSEEQENGAYICDKKHSKILLDYITNLQQENHDLKSKLECYENGVYYSSKVDELEQENERLKELNAELKAITKRPTPIDYAMLQKRYEDYKSRCEKAIEYNNQIIKDTKGFYRPTTDIIYSGDSLIEIATNNINILQNGGEKDD